jgi:hypothetical protein
MSRAKATETVMVKGVTLCRCERCAVWVRVAETRNEAPTAWVSILRHAKEPSGLCINCAVTEWVRSWQGIPLLLDDYGPQVLLMPEWQASVPRLLELAGCDARAEQINWQRVVENWGLPL